MRTVHLETDNGFEIRLDLDANNQIEFFDFSIPRRELDADDYRRVNKAIDNLKK